MGLPEFILILICIIIVGLYGLIIIASRCGLTEKNDKKR